MLEIKGKDFVTVPIFVLGSSSSYPESSFTFFSLISSFCSWDNSISYLLLPRGNPIRPFTFTQNTTVQNSLNRNQRLPRMLKPLQTLPGRETTAPPSLLLLRAWFASLLVLGTGVQLPAHSLESTEKCSSSPVPVS